MAEVEIRPSKFNSSSKILREYYHHFEEFETESVEINCPAFCNEFVSSFVEEYDSKDDDEEKLLQLVEKVSQKLLTFNFCMDARSDFSKKLRKLTNSYKKVMEEFSSKLDKWAELRKMNIYRIQNSVQKFRSLNRTTTNITFISATLECLLGLTTLMHKLFDFSLSPRYPKLITVVGGLSITGSLIALSYSNRTIEDIIKDMREEKRLVRDLEIIYRRGNWIDKDVQDLFPQGIDLKLVKKLVFDANGNLFQSWKQNICSAIILSNIKKDRKLLYDEKFLEATKAFVESTAAQIWINRMKLRKLLDDMAKRLENLPDKKTIIGNGVFLNRAAINLYPLLFPLFFDSGNVEKMKFMCSSMAAITAVLSYSDSEDEEFEDMKQTSLTLQEDYKHIKKMAKDLVSDYD